MSTNKEQTKNNSENVALNIMTMTRGSNPDESNLIKKNYYKRKK